MGEADNINRWDYAVKYTRRVQTIALAMVSVVTNETIFTRV